MSTTLSIKFVSRTLQASPTLLGSLMLPCAIHSHSNLSIIAHIGNSLDILASLSIQTIVKFIKFKLLLPASAVRASSVTLVLQHHSTPNLCSSKAILHLDATISALPPSSPSGISFVIIFACKLLSDAAPLSSPPRPAPCMPRHPSTSNFTSSASPNFMVFPTDSCFKIRGNVTGSDSLIICTTHSVLSIHYLTTSSRFKLCPVTIKDNEPNGHQQSGILSHAHSHSTPQQTIPVMS